MTHLNLYQKLKPRYRDTLLGNTPKYGSSVRTIIAKLESTSFWSDLTISEISTLDTFGECESFKWGPWTWRYGDGILVEDEK